MNETVVALNPGSRRGRRAYENDSQKEFLGQHDVSPKAVRQEYLRTVASDEYRTYAPYRPYLDAAMDVLLPDVADKLAPEAARVVDAEKKCNSLYRSVPPFGLTVLGMLSAVGFLYGQYFFPGPGERPFITGFEVPVTLASAVAGIAMITGRVRWRRMMDAATAEWRLASGNYKVRLSSLVQDSFTLVLNETLGPRKKLTFPTVAPRLVELSSSTVISSALSKALKDFILGHQSSAIGIAGPRGSGKSTLMRGLKADKSWDPLLVPMTAPVRYEPVDFIRRLYLNIAKEVLGELDDGKTVRRSRAFWTRLYFPALALGAGAACIGVDLLPAGTLPQINLSPIGIAGAVLITYGLPAYIFELFRRANDIFGRTSRKRRGSANSAAEAVTRLSYLSEANMKRKTGGKLFGGNFSVEDEDSVTLKERELSHPDLVDGVKSLLRATALDQQDRLVIVTIDELDKMGSTEELIATVNDLKDLFHIDGVHFIVSVSTDALHTFEQRGLSVRDAFDSSFDTILRVKPLTVDESLNLIAARAEGFPPLIAAFCHAWSGGLPRDLLRTARLCVELQRSAEGGLSMEALVRRVLSEDILSLAEAAIRSPKTRKTERQFLSAIRQQARALGSGEAASPALSCDKASMETIGSVLALANGLAKYVANSDTLSSGAWHGTITDKKVFEAAAIAMSARAEPAEIRTERFDTAFAVLADYTDEPSERESSNS